MKVVTAVSKSFLVRENFLALFTRLEKEGFTLKRLPISYGGLLALGIAKKWLDKRKYKRQRIYHRFVNKKEILVLTTYSEELNGANPSGTGWVIIKDLVTGGIIFSFEIHRSSKNFFDNLYNQAVAHVEVAQKWPKCQFCKISLVPMKINESIMHDREFICAQPGCIGFCEPTNKFITTLELSKEHSEVFLSGYKRYQKYAEGNRANNKETFPKRKYRYYAKLGISLKGKKIALEEGVDTPHDDSGLYPNG